MDEWLEASLDYIPHWLEFQMRASEQPSRVVAIAHKDRIVFGCRDVAGRRRSSPLP
jgi:D-alanyl-D-alanine carboxypeptidase